MENSTVIINGGGDSEGRDLETFYWGVFHDGVVCIHGVYFRWDKSRSFSLGVVLLLPAFFGDMVWLPTVEAEFLLEASISFFFGEGATL